MRERRRRHWLADVPIITTFVVLVVAPWETWLGGGLDLGGMLRGPSLAHPLGTDNLGRDLLVRIAAAIRGGVLPLWLTVMGASAGGFLAGVVAILLGQSQMVARALTFVTAVAAAVAAIPVGIAAFALAAWREAAGLAPVMLALGTLFVIRTYLETLDLYRHDRELGYWEAHESLGGSLGERLLRYGALGTWRGSLIESLGFHLKAAVAIEAALSYLGFGIQEPQASFGNMLASHFDLYLKGNFWVLGAIVAALALTAAAPSAAARLLSRRS